MAYTIPEILAISEISQFLADNDIAKKGLFAGGIDGTLPRQIYETRRNVKWMYALDTTDSTLASTGNYLYALCGIYAGQALSIMNGGSGGSVSPTNSNTKPDKLDFTVADSGSIMISGQSVIYIDGSNGLPDMRGFEIMFSRGALVQSVNDIGGTYYTWNPYNGKFECFGAANLDEQFIVQPTL